MKKRQFILVFLSLFIVAGVAHGANYILGYSAVDNGEIRWGGSTKYNNELSSAINIWNQMGKIDIVADSLNTYEDLTISDVYKNDVTWLGVYKNKIGSDTIRLNKYYLDGHSPHGNMDFDIIRHTILHELGHALGLDHHNLQNNVMRSGAWSYSNLGYQDKKDYNYLW